MTLPDLTAVDLCIIPSSAGKDSAAMLDLIATEARRLGLVDPETDMLDDRFVVVHNNLGTTDNGIPVEWPQTEELARHQAELYKVRFIVTHREKGGLYQEIRQRGKFPWDAGRFCTADQKTSPTMKLVTQLVGELGITDRPARVLYCLGLRAQESAGRAKKPVSAIDQKASSGRREITRQHPILHWTEKQVWAAIDASKVPHHAAYDLGMTRLSCVFCVLAKHEHNVRAAYLRPELAQEYLALEEEIGSPFKFDPKQPHKSVSMRKIIADAAEQYGTEPPRPADWFSTKPMSCPTAA